LSGSADTSVKLWDAELGKELSAWGHRAPVRSVNYAAGEKSYVSVTDQVLGFPAGIYIWDLNAPAKGTLFC
jgi:translation initiation factor 3 subunit I